MFPACYWPLIRTRQISAVGFDGGDEIRVAGHTPVTIEGASGDDSLKGGDGDDVLRGNDGYDDLRGGAGTTSLMVGPGKIMRFMAAIQQA